MKVKLYLLLLLFFGLGKLYAQNDPYSAIKVFPKEIVLNYPLSAEGPLTFEVYGFSKTGDSTLIDACSLSYELGKGLIKKFLPNANASCCSFLCLAFEGNAGDKTYMFIADTANPLIGDTLWVRALSTPFTLQPMDTIVYLKEYMQYQALSGKSKLNKEINWSVSDTALATIDTDGKLYAKKEGDVNVIASLDNDIQKKDTIVAHLSLRKHPKVFLSITPFLRSITLRDTLSMKAIAYYTNEDSIGIQPQWTVSDSNLAHIDANGLLTPIDTGTLIVQAKIDSLKATTEIKIENPLLSLRMTSSLKPLIKGQTRKLELSGVFANGAVKDLSDVFSWTVLDTSILAIDEDSHTAKGLEAGITSITTRWQGVSVSFPFVVTNYVVSLTLSPADTAILEKDSLQYSVTGKFQDGSVKSLTDQVQYQLKMGDIATINPDGMLNAKAVGSTAISAMYKGATAKAKVKVINPLYKVLISPKDTTVSVGETFTYRGIAVYEDREEKPIQEEAQWLSLNQEIATINPSTGEVTTLKKGTCRFVLMYKGVGSREATLNITD